MKGFARALYLLSLIFIFFCLLIITGLIAPGPVPELTAAWRDLFGNDTAAAAFAFAALCMLWLGCMLPVLFLGKGPVSAVCFVLLMLLLGAVVLSGNVVAAAFWMVLFFVFCVTFATERRRTRARQQRQGRDMPDNAESGRAAPDAAAKALAKARAAAAAAGRMAADAGKTAAQGRSTLSGQELRRYAESVEDKAIQSSRPRH